MRSFQYFLKRPSSVDKIIRSSWGEVSFVPEFIDGQLVEELAGLSVNQLGEEFAQEGKAFKTTGFQISSLDMDKKYSQIAEVVERIKTRTGREDSLLANCAFIDIGTPLPIHTDSGTDPEQVIFKSFQLVLKSPKGNSVVFFRQRHSGQKMTFCKGGSGSAIVGPSGMYLNREEYGILETIDINFSDKEGQYLTNKNLMPHIDPKSLEGLEVEKVVEPKPGDLIIWDTGQLHCTGTPLDNRNSKLILQGQFELPR